MTLQIKIDIGCEIIIMLSGRIDTLLFVFIHIFNNFRRQILYFRNFLIFITQQGLSETRRMYVTLWATSRFDKCNFTALPVHNIITFLVVSAENQYVNVF